MSRATRKADRELIREAKNPPYFSDECDNGKCAECSGSQFKTPRHVPGTAPSVIGWIIYLPLALIRAVFQRSAVRRYTECVTCGATYRVG